MLFYGPNGVGKRTRALCVLEAIFGPEVQNVRFERDIVEAGTRKIEVNCLHSKRTSLEPACDVPGISSAAMTGRRLFERMPIGRYFVCAPVYDCECV